MPQGSLMRTVLLVEDDEGYAYAAAKTLTAAGFTVTMAPDYRDALRVLEGADAPRLLLVDIRLPTVHGFALGRMARQRRPGIKVIYITSYRDLPQDELDTALGKILYKPIEPETLIAEVAQAFESPHS
jgi:DNA-binding NtrC family response regulator